MYVSSITAKWDKTPCTAPAQLFRRPVTFARNEPVTCASHYLPLPCRLPAAICCMRPRDTFAIHLLTYQYSLRDSVCGQLGTVAATRTVSRRILRSFFYRAPRHRLAAGRQPLYYPPLPALITGRGTACRQSWYHVDAVIAWAERRRDVFMPVFWACGSCLRQIYAYQLFVAPFSLISTTRILPAAVVTRMHCDHTELTSAIGVASLYSPTGPATLTSSSW